MPSETTPVTAGQRLSIFISNWGWGFLIWLPLIGLWLVGALRGIRIIRNVPYIVGGDAQQRLDITIPRGAGKDLPIIIYMHGGGFVLGSKFTHRPIGYAYARRGYLVFNLDYRTAPYHRFPAALADCCHAYAWIVQNAGKYGGDVTRVTVAGESAGANLATGVTIAACYPRAEPWMRAVWDTGVVPVAAKLICGYVLVTHPERYRGFKGSGTWESRNGPSVAFAFAQAYLGREGLAASDTNLLADPVRFFESGQTPARPLPALFVAVGSGDLLADDNERFCRALTQCGAAITARVYPGEEHVFHMKPWRRRSSAEFWRHGFEFLEQNCPSVPATEQEPVARRKLA